MYDADQPGNLIIIIYGNIFSAAHPTTLSSSYSSYTLSLVWFLAPNWCSIDTMCIGKLEHADSVAPKPTINELLYFAGYLISRGGQICEK